MYWLQGRARPSLAKLYNWRYRALGDLPAVVSKAPFTTANAGFALDFQLIDVPDFQVSQRTGVPGDHCTASA